MATVREVENLVKQLRPAEQLQLVRKLEHTTWANRLDAVVNRIRQHAPRLTQQEIQRLCREVRRERSARARRP